MLVSLDVRLCRYSCSVWRSLDVDKDRKRRPLHGGSRRREPGRSSDRAAVAVRGELLFFNEETGHGFIRTEEGERLYVARESFAPGHVPVGRCAGVVVDFTRGAGVREHAFEAFDVTKVSEPAVGRARLRGTRKGTR